MEKEPGPSGDETGRTGARGLAGGNQLTDKKPLMLPELNDALNPGYQLVRATRNHRGGHFLAIVALGSRYDTGGNGSQKVNPNRFRGERFTPTLGQYCGIDAPLATSCLHPFSCDPPAFPGRTAIRLAEQTHEPVRRSQLKAG